MNALLSRYFSDYTLSFHFQLPPQHGNFNNNSVKGTQRFSGILEEKELWTMCAPEFDNDNHEAAMLIINSKKQPCGYVQREVSQIVFDIMKESKRTDRLFFLLCEKTGSDPGGYFPCNFHCVGLDNVVDRCMENEQNDVVMKDDLHVLE